MTVAPQRVPTKAEQKKRLLKAKIAVALRDELGRVPKSEEIEQVFLLTRVMYKAVLGLHFKRASHLRSRDMFVVWRLDRLGRSLRHLIDTITALEAQGIGFKSLQENIDTTTSSGKLIFHIFGSLAEFERDLIQG
jgi:Resolvase, N terminal domain